MKTTQQDLESLNLSLNEAIDVAQNHPLWRMMSMNEWMNACEVYVVKTIVCDYVLEDLVVYIHITVSSIVSLLHYVGFD